MLVVEALFLSVGNKLKRQSVTKLVATIASWTPENKTCYAPSIKMEFFCNDGCDIHGAGQRLKVLFGELYFLTVLLHPLNISSRYAKYDWIGQSMTTNETHYGEILS